MVPKRSGRVMQIPKKWEGVGNPNGKWYLREVGKSWKFPMVLPPKE
jgi:hypothetical protein